MTKKLLIFFQVCGVISATAFGQDNNSWLKDSAWSWHFQFTGVLQGHPSFDAPYTGQNSLSPSAEKAFSVTSTLFVGRKLWQGASLYFNPEMAGGRGISSTLGIAAFPNGETFRVGNPEPTVYVGRIFLHQSFNLDKSHQEYIADDMNQVRETRSTSRIDISLGKFGMADFFDDNSVSHDPRKDFMNWAFMNNGAYDYPANTRGYTYGLVLEYIHPRWTIRAATALMPNYSNGPTLNFNYAKTNSETVEYERNYLIGKRKGTIRLLSYFNTSKAPNYEQVIADKLSGVDTTLDVIYGKNYGGKKYGFGLNAEQQISDYVNAFVRLGWNDGKTATWAFAEIDNTITGGIRISGAAYNRITDNIGVALLCDGISAGHRDFLKAGGYGFMIGDGQLPHYGREDITELFYQSRIFDFLYVTLDYQFVLHPAYNKDRGPVNVFGLRTHIEL